MLVSVAFFVVCSIIIEQVSIEERYAAMRDALNNTGRPILFSMCEWGVSSPWLYGSGVNQRCCLAERAAPGTYDNC